MERNGELSIDFPYQDGVNWQSQDYRVDEVRNGGGQHLKIQQIYTAIQI